MCGVPSIVTPRTQTSVPVVTRGRTSHASSCPMPVMPRAIRFDRTGGPEVLYVAELASTAPGPGQVQIRQRAIGVNFIDVYHRSGLYAVPGLPSGLGGEAAGVVTAVGSGVTEFKSG